MRHFRQLIPSLVLHLGFIVIIAGALLTHFLAYQGTVYMQPGQTLKSFADTRGNVHTLPQDIRLVKFHIPAYPGTDKPSDYVSELETSTGRVMAVRMNHPGRLGGYELYQWSYDGYGGTVLLVRHDVAGTCTVYFGFLMFATGGAWLLGRRFRVLKFRWSVPMLVLSITCAVVLGIFARRWVGQEYLLPVLNTPWLGIHVSLMMLAYALLGSTLPLSVAALVLNKRRKHLNDFAGKLLLPGVYLLGLGIITGSIWANQSWGRYWDWDPKESWALITFLVYSGPLHKVFKLKGNPQALSVYLIFAALFIIMTWWGVNFMTSLHAY